MQIITSKDNETVKNIKKLKDKKYRDEAGLYIIEGVKMIEEAIVANAKIDKIVVCEECLKNRRYRTETFIWNCKIWLHICKCKSI